jgi:hypothetical protein
MARKGRPICRPDRARFEHAGGAPGRSILVLPENLAGAAYESVFRCSSGHPVGFPIVVAMITLDGESH